MKLNISRPVLYVLLLTFIFSSFARPPHNFQDAKKKMYEIYRDHRESIYCGCSFDENRNTNFESCGYKVRKDAKRAQHMEAEHIVPAWMLGHTLACWKEKRCSDSHGKKYGGRKCCRKIDPYFREMESDLYNLAPAVGEVNADRQDYSFIDWNGVATEYGQCDIVIDFPNRRVQPPYLARGIIARTYLYMAKKYHLKLSDEENKRYANWNKQFPMTAWEQLRSQRIEVILNS